MTTHPLDIAALVGATAIVVGTLTLMRVVIAERHDGQRLPGPRVWLLGLACGACLGGLWDAALWARAHVWVGFY